MEQRHNEAQDWATRLQHEQESAVSLIDSTTSYLQRLPADPGFRKLLPVLEDKSEDSKQHAPTDTTLSSFIPAARLEAAAKDLRTGLDNLAKDTSQLTTQVDSVFKSAGELFEDVEKTQSESVSGLQRDAGQLLEEIEVIGNKVASDYDHVASLQAGTKSVSQASNMALLHTRDYLPSLRDNFEELNRLVHQTVQQRNSAATRVMSNMQKVAEVEGLFANADTQAKNLDFHTHDERAPDLINLVVQLPFTYGALLLEAVRRREWVHRIREESSTLAEDIASYREEEEKRRRRWHKTIGGVVAEEASNTSVLNFELNLHPDQGAWPEADRQAILDYVAAMKLLPDQEEAIEELEAGFDDLDKPTKRQAKAAKTFKNGSLHDAHAPTGSFFLRNNEEVKMLQDSNHKLGDEIKSQKSRVRKLEDLLYKQGQAGRTPSGISFQTADGAMRDMPTPEPYSPVLDYGEKLARKASVSSRRTSATGTPEEKSLAKRIVSLEADLHAQKQRNDELERRAQGRERTPSHVQSRLDDAESTKRDLMANLEAVQREFASERRLLEDEIEKHKSRNEEVEEELDRILGSRDAEIGVEEKLRSLESELEHTKAALNARQQELKQHRDAQGEHHSALTNIHSVLGGDAEEVPSLHDELIHKLEDVAERAMRQQQELGSLVNTTRSEKEELQTLLDRKEKESFDVREAIQALEEETSRLRNDKLTQQATTESVHSELADAREQLKALRAKFGDGETGSNVLQQRLSDQASRASTLATELAQAKSHVNSLDVELSSLQRRHNNVVTSNTESSNILEQRTLKARELTNRLITCYQDLIRLIGSLGLSMYKRDGVLVIQRPSKAGATASTATIDTSASISGSTILPQAPSFDAYPDPMLASWMHASSIDEETERFRELLAKLDQFSLTTFSEAVIKLRRDVEWTGKKWKMEARNYRDKFHRAQAEAHDKIAFRSFKEGDLALFLPTRNQATRPWAAFNVNAPHCFLREQESHKLKTKEWLVARVLKIEDRHVDLSKTMNNSLKADRGSNADKASESNVSVEDDNPFELSDGLRWYLLDAVEEKIGAPSTPSVGKSTVASATDHAKGSNIDMKKVSAGNDASAKLQSLESRRSSTNSKRGSISGGSIAHKESNEEVIAGTRSPTLVERGDGASVRSPSIVERSSSRASHRNAPSRSSGLGIEIKDTQAQSNQEGRGTSIDEVRRDLLWGP